jgi:hypothetical protein
MLKIRLLCVGLLCGGLLFAQLPTSNVYLFDLTAGDRDFRFSNPRYLTDFNPVGYNNQPVFISDEELFLTVQLPSMAQPDIYAFNLADRTKTRITRTPSGEYSPQRMPDYYNFSAVRQEIVDRDTVLRLWQFPLNRLTNGRPIFRYLTGMGYYTWLDSRRLALFIVDDPSYLALANTDRDEVTPIASNVGRCFQRMPNGNLAYVQKSEYGPWYLMEKNIYRADAEPRQLVATLPNAEDFFVLPTGVFLMGKGSKIFAFDPLRDSDWRELVDLRFYQIKNITRLAVSNDYKIAIVAD